MLNIIIGRNCSGKTTKLKELIFDSIRNKDTYSSNIERMVNPYTCIEQDYIYNDYELNSNTIKIIKKYTDIKDIVKNGKETLILGANNYSSYFINILKIISLDVKYVYIDMPECNLTMYELCMLCDILNFVTQERDIWITTHSSGFLTAMDITVYTIDENGNLKEDDSYYVNLI